MPTGTTRGLLFNASASGDPEGRTLQYDWFRGTGAISLTPEEACTSEIKQKANGTSLIYLGQGVTYRYDVPTGIASPMPIQLVVRDPGCLYGTQTNRWSSHDASLTSSARTDGSSSPPSS